MKFLPLLVIGSALIIGGCASPENGARTAAAASDGESYIPLGSSIPKKGPRRTEDKTMDMQRMENDRITNNGTINSAH
jgi:hypothetical protein